MPLPSPPPQGPTLTGGLFSHLHPQRDLTLDPHPSSICPQAWGWGRVEKTGPSPLRSIFLPKLSSHPAPSPQQKPEPLLGKQLQLAAAPPLLSSTAPISSYLAPSELPLLHSSSKPALSHFRIWRCLTCFLQA